MQKVYEQYLQIIKGACTNHPLHLTLSKEEQEALLPLARRHFTAPFVLPYITDAHCLQLLKQQTKQMMLQYHQIEYFTHYIFSLFKQAHIPCFLLKGISLAEYYPMPESRKLGDVDLYINDENFLDLAKHVLESNCFTAVDELSDHHLTYEYCFSKINRTFILELHFRVVGLYQFSPANAVVDRIYAAGQLTCAKQTINDICYPVLPSTEYCFYMLHHMLKHYLYSGFGIRLLCDFVFYLTAHAADIDFQKIHAWCQESHIFHLYEIILESCRIYLGLPDTIDANITAPSSDCEQFIQRILSDNDMGTTTASTLVGSASYQTVNLFTYIKEFHLQMHVRFPKAGKHVLLWPVLWSITLFYFIKNTYCLRNTTLRETFRSFKANNQKSKAIRIFDNSDS